MFEDELYHNMMWYSNNYIYIKYNKENVKLAAVLYTFYLLHNNLNNGFKYTTLLHNFCMMNKSLINNSDNIVHIYTYSPYIIKHDLEDDLFIPIMLSIIIFKIISIPLFKIPSISFIWIIIISIIIDLIYYSERSLWSTIIIIVKCINLKSDKKIISIIISIIINSLRPLMLLINKTHLLIWNRESKNIRLIYKHEYIPFNEILYRFPTLYLHRTAFYTLRTIMFLEKIKIKPVPLKYIINAYSIGLGGKITWF
jgi:hypothetical protein